MFSQKHLKVLFLLSVFSKNIFSRSVFRIIIDKVFLKAILKNMRNHLQC